MAPVNTRFLVEADEPAPRGRTTRGVKKPRIVLQAPSWKPREIAHAAASGTVESSVLDTLFSKTLLRYPNKLKLRLLELLKKSPANKLFVSREQDITDLHNTLKDLLHDAGTMDSEVHPRMVVVLAAYLGAEDLPLPSDWISDGTFLEDDDTLAGLNIRQREMTELACNSVIPRFVSEAGVVRCYCGKEASFKIQQGWTKNSPNISYYTCQDGRCRMHITVNALAYLGGLMDEMGVDSFPALFCPKHPDRDVKISEQVDDKTGKVTLQARCSWYNNEDGKKEFCVREYLGSDGDAWKCTGEQVWKALDLLFRQK